MMKKFIWRLKEIPTAEAVRELVASGIITKDEARQILFSEQEDTERNIESFKEEIKFLRELVEKLSNRSHRSQTIAIIREIQKPYYPNYWYKPYELWCGAAYTSATPTQGNNTIGNNFSNITTF